MNGLDLKSLADQAEKAIKAADVAASLDPNNERLKGLLREEISLILQQVFTPIAGRGGRVGKISLALLQEELQKRFKVSDMSPIPYTKVMDTLEGGTFLLPDPGVSWNTITRIVASDLYRQHMKRDVEGEFFTYEW